MAVRRPHTRPKVRSNRQEIDATALPARFDGRFLAPDGREYPCRTIDMSADVIAVRSDYVSRIGVRIVLYLEEWGRFEGAVIRSFDRGFTVAFEATDSKRAHMAMQLAWLSRHRLLDGSAIRGHQRIVPNHPFTTFTLADVTLPCEIIDLSRRGAALKTGVKVQNGVKLTLGKGTRAEVVRQTEDGFAVQFQRLLPLEQFDEDIEL
ncbi:MAG: pilus assembly protein PilZ [Methylocystaceae bacterium]|nr:MAG: pilus assembly protein PilZ [Methylocystaceae bacterium]